MGLFHFCFLLVLTELCFVIFLSEAHPFQLNLWELVKIGVAIEFLTEILLSSAGLWGISDPEPLAIKLLA